MSKAYNMYVFVYGTLKRGYGNNRLLSNSTFVQEDIVPGFKAYNSGFPVSAHDTGSRLAGEVWDIGDPERDKIANETLRRLDSLEGEGSMYHRKIVTTEGGHFVNLYVGGPNFWPFDRMEECPKDENGIYYWSRD